MAKRTEDKYVKLECAGCGKMFYRTHKNKKTIKERLNLSKYCVQCRKHTAHKETK